MYKLKPRSLKFGAYMRHMTYWTEQIESLEKQRRPVVKVLFGHVYWTFKDLNHLKQGRQRRTLSRLRDRLHPEKSDRVK